MKTKNQECGALIQATVAGDITCAEKKPCTIHSCPVKEAKHKPSCNTIIHKDSSCTVMHVGSYCDWNDCTCIDEKISPKDTPKECEHNWKSNPDWTTCNTCLKTPPSKPDEWVKKELVKLFEDWGIENIKNLMTHIKPILEKVKDNAERKGRSYVYEKVLPEALSSQKSEWVRGVENLTKWDSANFGGMVTEENGEWVKIQEVKEIIKNL